MTLFQKVKTIFGTSLQHESAAQSLLKTFLATGYLPLMPKELVDQSDSVMAIFFEILAVHRGFTVDAPPSPVATKKDSGWMNQRDFAFVNAKATGTREGIPGNFFQAAKLLPGLRADAIHLAPFLDCEFHVIYAIRSYKTIDRDVLHPTLTAGGLSSFEQLQYFVQVCHLLDKVVGFDLEPHASQFSVQALEHPEAFRWIKVYPEERKWLDYYMNPQSVYLRENQNRLIKEVKSRVSWILRQEDLTTFDELPGDSNTVLEAKMQAYEKTVLMLIKEGYWTVPSHTWDSVGLPEFYNYNKEENYPEFQYRNSQGRDSSSYAYHLVSPLAFYHDLPHQGSSSPVHPQLNQSALDLFCETFLYWRDLGPFDFVRHDSVDHIFDSINEDDGHFPLSDRPTPYVLTEFIRRSKLGGKSWIGHMAERMGNEIEDYQAIGYDLILGSDMLELVDQKHIEKSFQLHGQLELLNQRRKTPFSITYAVDTHDTGNKHFWGEPLIEKLGHRGLLQKLFLSRYLSFGLSRRPQYSVMGIGDLSYGLFESNVSNKNLRWIGNRDFFTEYTRMENLYNKLRPFLESSKVTIIKIDETTASWTLTSQGEELMVQVNMPDELSAPPPTIPTGYKSIAFGPDCFLWGKLPALG